MTKAVCIYCGEFKHGAWTPCEQCGKQPGDIEDLARSIVASDHHFPPKDLNALKEAFASCPNWYEHPKVSALIEDYKKEYVALEHEHGSIPTIGNPALASAPALADTSPQTRMIVLCTALALVVLLFVFSNLPKSSQGDSIKSQPIPEAIAQTDSTQTDVEILGNCYRELSLVAEKLYAEIKRINLELLEPDDTLYGLMQEKRSIDTIQRHTVPSIQDDLRSLDMGVSISNHAVRRIEDLKNTRNDLEKIRDCLIFVADCMTCIDVLEQSIASNTHLSLSDRNAISILLKHEGLEFILNEYSPGLHAQLLQVMERHLEQP